MAPNYFTRPLKCLPVENVLYPLKSQVGGSLCKATLRGAVLLMFQNCDVVLNTKSGITVSLAMNVC